jgi:hypothetical protein
MSVDLDREFGRNWSTCALRTIVSNVNRQLNASRLPPRHPGRLSANRSMPLAPRRISQPWCQFGPRPSNSRPMSRGRAVESVVREVGREKSGRGKVNERRPAMGGRAPADRTQSIWCQCLMLPTLEQSIKLSSVHLSTLLHSLSHFCQFHAPIHPIHSAQRIMLPPIQSYPARVRSESRHSHDAILTHVDNSQHGVPNRFGHPLYPCQGRNAHRSDRMMRPVRSAVRLGGAAVRPENRPRGRPVDSPLARAAVPREHGTPMDIAHRWAPFAVREGHQ